jgi:hypothetical protein
MVWKKECVLVTYTCIESKIPGQLKELRLLYTVVAVKFVAVQILELFVLFTLVFEFLWLNGHDVENIFNLIILVKYLT